MSTTDYTTTFTVDRAPQQVFEAINDPRAWWSERIVGSSGRVADSFVYDVPGVHHCTMTTTHAEPGRLVIWEVTDSTVAFVDDEQEWEGTRVRFELTERDGGTELTFTHLGLTPAGHCYDVCADAWGGYITRSLRALIERGAGSPMRRDEVVRLADVRAMIRAR